MAGRKIAGNGGKEDRRKWREDERNSSVAGDVYLPYLCMVETIIIILSIIDRSMATGDGRATPPTIAHCRDGSSW
jgi:hypothetical protein